MHGPPCIFWANLTPFSLKFYTVLAYVLLFSAFPMNLHAFSVFFCMDASDEHASQRNQDGLLETENTPPPALSVLQSDHAIHCNTTKHEAVRALSILVVLCLVVGMPCAFMRSIRRLLHSADLLHDKLVRHRGVEVASFLWGS